MNFVAAVFWNARERRPRALWRLVLMVVAIGIIAVAPIVAVGESVAALHRQGVLLPGLSASRFDKTMDFVFGPLFGVLIIGAILISSRVIDRRASGLGLRLSGDWWVEYGFGLVLGAALIALVFALELAMGWVRVERRMEPSIMNVPAAMLWAFVAVKALCVGAYEETVSRGGVLKNLAEGLGAAPPWIAALLAAALASVIFSALHATTDNFTAASFWGLAVNGLLLAAPVLLTGRLGMSMGLHTTWNFTQGGVFGYPVSGDIENISLLTSTATGPVAWTGGSYGPEAGYVSWIAAIAGIAAIALFVRLRSVRVAILPAVAGFQRVNTERANPHR